MASVKKQDIPTEAALFPALWEYVKKYYIPENDDAYWDAVVADANALMDKYPCDLAKRYASVTIDYLDKKWRQELADRLAAFRVKREFT